jgi:archaellum component FlaC
MSEEQFKALNERLSKIDNGLVLVSEGVTGLHTAVADARRDIGGLGEKLVRIQEALYYIAHKILPAPQSEELRSMLPDPPKRLASFGR